MTLDKARDPNINPSDPWSDDDLKRKGEGDVLLRLIHSLENRSYVIGVRGKWGTGKSIFLKRLAASLELQSPKVPVIRIDAWRTDYFVDPLLAFVAATDERMAAERSLPESVRAKFKSIVEGLVGNAASLSAPIATAAGDLAAPGAGAVAGAAAGASVQVTAEIIRQIRRQKSAETEFREKLAEARDYLTGRETGPLRPIVVTVDELDRCRPDYAIRTLERIKHFFNVPGVIFIVATDGKNLPNAVSAVYGEKFQGEPYLRRFFDYEFELSEPDTAHFVPVLEEQFDFTKIIEGSRFDRDNLSKKYLAPYDNGYSVAITALDRGLDAYEIVAGFQRVAGALGLTLRDQSQAFTIINAYLRSIPEKTIVYPALLVMLSCLRFGAPDVYEGILAGRVKLSNALDSDFVRDRPKADRMLNASTVGWEYRYLASAIGHEDSDKYIRDNRDLLRREGGYDKHGKLAAIERLDTRRSADATEVARIVPRVLRLANAFS